LNGDRWPSFGFLGAAVVRLEKHGRQQQHSRWTNLGTVQQAQQQHSRRLSLSQNVLAGGTVGGAIPSALTEPDSGRFFFRLPQQEHVHRRHH